MVIYALIIAKACRRAVFLKLSGITPLGGNFEWKGSEKTKGGNRGEKQHKGGKNAQPPIDH